MDHINLTIINYNINDYGSDQSIFKEFFHGNKPYFSQNNALLYDDRSKITLTSRYKFQTVIKGLIIDYFIIYLMLT